eukprot:932411-Pyramimonas_sp.AAC.1
MVTRQRVATLPRFPETSKGWRHLHLPLSRIRHCIILGTRASCFEHPEEYRNSVERVSLPRARRVKPSSFGTVLVLKFFLTDDQG